MLIIILDSWRFCDEIREKICNWTKILASNEIGMDNWNNLVDVIKIALMRLLITLGKKWVNI